MNAINDPNLISVMQEAVERLNLITDQMFAMAILLVGLSMATFFGRKTGK